MDQPHVNQPDLAGTPALTARLLDADEVAQMLGVRKSWVYAQARARRIPHVRLGRYTRFRADSIEAWAAEREEGPVPVTFEAPRRSEP